MGLQPQILNDWIVTKPNTLDTEAMDAWFERAPVGAEWRFFVRETGHWAPWLLRHRMSSLPALWSSITDERNTHQQMTDLERAGDPRVRHPKFKWPNAPCPKQEERLWLHRYPGDDSPILPEWLAGAPDEFEYLGELPRTAP